MLDQPWPVLLGAAAVVLFFACLLTYILVIGVRKEKREREAIAARKQSDMQKMILKMRERQQGKPTWEEITDTPRRFVPIPSPMSPAIQVTTEETPAGADGSSEIKIRNVGLVSGSLETALIQTTARLRKEIHDDHRVPPVVLFAREAISSHLSIPSKKLQYQRKRMFDEDYDESLYPPPRGRALNSYCDGTTFKTVYADGSGGHYEHTVSFNSAQCGYNQ